MERYKPVLLRGFNNYDVRAASEEAGTVPGDEPSLTQQHFAEEADINVIVERFGLLGELPQNVRPPVYGDFTGVSDYQTALNQIIAADEAFMAMPAKVRLRFHNDAAEFVDFCSDPANIEEMRALGLAVPKKEDGDGQERGGSDGGVGASARGKVASSGERGGGDADAAGGRSGGAGAGAGQGAR